MLLTKRSKKRITNRVWHSILSYFIIYCTNSGNYQVLKNLHHWRTKNKLNNKKRKSWISYSATRPYNLLVVPLFTMWMWRFPCYCKENSFCTVSSTGKFNPLIYPQNKGMPFFPYTILHLNCRRVNWKERKKLKCLIKKVMGPHHFRWRWVHLMQQQVIQLECYCCLSSSPGVYFLSSLSLFSFHHSSAWCSPNLLLLYIQPPEEGVKQTKGYKNMIDTSCNVP